MQLSFLKEITVGNTTSVIFDGVGELKIYIPTSYYPTYASELGQRVSSLGVFVYEYGNKKYIQTLPIKIEFEFSGKEKFKGKLKAETPSDEYDVYILNKGDAFITDINHVQDLYDVELGINRFIIDGKLPTFLTYEQAYNVLIKLLTVTGINDSLNVSGTIYEFIFSELYRNKNDQYEPFRKWINGRENADLYNYKLVKMTQTPALHSTFNAMTGRDASQQILNAVLRHRNNAKDVESPIEKVLKY